MILVPRVEGVETKPIKTSYSASAGTAYVTFDKVRVPVEYTLGEEDGGLYVLLSNFNHERWVLCCISARAQRLITEECFKYESTAHLIDNTLTIMVDGLTKGRRLGNDS